MLSPPLTLSPSFSEILKQGIMVPPYDFFKTTFVIFTKKHKGEYYDLFKIFYFFGKKDQKVVTISEKEKLFFTKNVEAVFFKKEN